MNIHQSSKRIIISRTRTTLLIVVGADRQPVECIVHAVLEYHTSLQVELNVELEARVQIEEETQSAQSNTRASGQSAPNQKQMCMYTKRTLI